MKRIIADSYAAIQPDEKLMAKWIIEIKKLEMGEPVTEEDYYFIRSSDEIYHALMEITKGDADAITVGNVPQILERAKEIVRRDVEKKYLGEIDKRKETEAALAVFQAGEKRREEEREDRLHNKSRNMAYKATKLLRFAAIILLVFGIVITLPLNLIASEELVSSTLSQFPHFIIPALLLLMLVLSVANQYYGTTLNSCLNSLEMNIEKNVYKFLSSLAN
jgi:fumarate reductase subunit D